MPKLIPNQPPLCINHQDTYLILQNENKPHRYHAVAMTHRSSDGSHRFITKGTPVNIYACPECGYCEMYIPDHDIPSLSKP